MSEISAHDEELLRYVFDMLDGNSDGLLEFKDVVEALRRSAEVGALLNASIRIGNQIQETLMRRISKIVFEESQVIDFKKFSDFVKLTDAQASMTLLQQVSPAGSTGDEDKTQDEKTDTAPKPSMVTPQPKKSHRRVRSFSKLSVVTSPPASKSRVNQKKSLNDKSSTDNTADQGNNSDFDDTEELDPEPMSAIEQLASTPLKNDEDASAIPSTALSSSPRVAALRGDTTSEVPQSPITAASSPGGTSLMRRKMQQQAEHLKRREARAQGGRAGPALASPRLTSPRRVDALRGGGSGGGEAASPITAASSPGASALMRRKMEQQAEHIKRRQARAATNPSMGSPRLTSPRRVDALREGAAEPAAHSPITTASSPGGNALMRRKMEQQAEHLKRRNARAATAPSMASPRLTSPRRVDALREGATEPAAHSPITSASSPGGNALMRRKMEQQAEHLKRRKARATTNPSMSSPRLTSPRRVDALRGSDNEPAAHSPITAASSPGGNALMRRKMEQQAEHLKRRKARAAKSASLSSPRLTSPRRVDALRGSDNEQVAHSPITAASSPGGNALMRRKMEQQAEHLKRRKARAEKNPSLSSPRLTSPRRVDALRNGGSESAAHSPITSASSPGGNALMRRKMEQQQKRNNQQHHRAEPQLASPRLPSPRRVDVLRGKTATAHSPVSSASSPRSTSLLRRKLQQQHPHLDNKGSPFDSSRDDEDSFASSRGASPAPRMSWQAPNDNEDSDRAAIEAELRRQVRVSSRLQVVFILFALLSSCTIHRHTVLRARATTAPTSSETTLMTYQTMGAGRESPRAD